MNHTDPEEIAIQWQHHKQEEIRHQALRRELEDLLVAIYAVPETLDETVTKETAHLQIKMVGRIDRKVDADKVQELAAEHGVEDHLSTLFRWKPELNMRQWNHADEKIRKALEGAITSKPGRPSFQVIPKNDR